MGKTTIRKGTSVTVDGMVFYHPERTTDNICRGPAVRRNDQPAVVVLNKSRRAGRVLVKADAGWAWVDADRIV